MTSGGILFLFVFLSLSFVCMNTRTGYETKLWRLCQLTKQKSPLLQALWPRTLLTFSALYPLIQVTLMPPVSLLSHYTPLFPISTYHIDNILSVFVMIPLNKSIDSLTHALTHILTQPRTVFSTICLMSSLSLCLCHPQFPESWFCPDVSQASSSVP